MAQITIKLSDEDIDRISAKVAEKILKSQDKEYYTIQEVAETTRSHKQTIYRHIREGLLTATKNGRDYIVSKDNLEKYINGEFLN